MKRHSYGNLIGMSWSWMIEILFRPFGLKKWIMLAVIILLAGQLGGNLNINLAGKKVDLDQLKDIFKKKAPQVSVFPVPLKAPIGLEGREKTIVPQGKRASSDVISKLAPILKNPKAGVIIALIMTPLILFTLFIILLWIWIKANFSFVFIDSVIRNDASLRIPFHRNKVEGNSFFRWSILYGFIVLLTFGSIVSRPVMQLVNAGAFTSAPVDPVKILSIILPYVPILVIAGILFGLISLFVLDFVLPIMYKKKIGILEAWRVFLGILKVNTGEVLLYLLVKLGLLILAIGVAIVIAIAGIIVLVITGGLLALLGFLIHAVTPSGAKGVILTILFLIGVPVYAFLVFLFNVFFIPIPIFFRLFSIYVLISMDESLDVFQPKTEEQLMLEGDDGQYAKSMRLVWFGVLSPVLIAILGILIAIAMPGFVKKRWKPPQIKGKGIGPLEEIKSLPDLLKEEPKGETVTVHLKNGNIFKAKLISETEDNVAFSVEGGTVVYPRADILRIERPEEEK